MLICLHVVTLIFWVADSWVVIDDVCWRSGRHVATLVLEIHQGEERQNWKWFQKSKHVTYSRQLCILSKCSKLEGSFISSTLWFLKDVAYKTSPPGKLFNDHNSGFLERSYWKILVTIFQYALRTPRNGSFGTEQGLLRLLRTQPHRKYQLYTTPC